MRQRGSMARSDDDRKRFLVPTFGPYRRAQPLGNLDLAPPGECAQRNCGGPPGDCEGPADDPDLARVLYCTQCLDGTMQGDEFDARHGSRQFGVSRDRHPLGLKAETADPRPAHGGGYSLDRPTRVLDAARTMHFTGGLLPVAEICEEDRLVRRDEK
jgi:hypothetical protein